MARRTFLLSEVTLTEEIVNQSVSGDLTVTGTSTLTGVVSFGSGTAAAPSITFIADTDTGFYYNTANVFNISCGGSSIGQFSSTGITLGDSQGFILGDSGDTKLVRDAANIYAMKNGTTAQTQRWYGTTTNSKYVQITHDGTNGIITTSGGVVGFAVHTSSAATNVNGITGYLSIVDEAGNARKIAVVT